MSAPIGNQFWKQRAKHGRDKIFSNPDILWESACEYFEWCDNNPWQKTEAAKAGDHFGEVVTAPTSRPYSQRGLCIFLDIDENTLTRYCEEDEYKDFWATANKIRNIIKTQQWEGAMVGAYNSNIAARSLGLTEKQDIDQNLNIIVKRVKKAPIDER